MTDQAGGSSRPRSLQLGRKVGGQSLSSRQVIAGTRVDVSIRWRERACSPLNLGILLAVRRLFVSAARTVGNLHSRAELTLAAHPIRDNDHAVAAHGDVNGNAAHPKPGQLGVLQTERKGIDRDARESPRDRIVGDTAWKAICARMEAPRFPRFGMKCRKRTRRLTAGGT